MIDSSLLIEGIHRTKKTLDTIKQLTRLSRGRFSDREFGEFFHRMITQDVEKIDFLLNGMLGYLKAIAPVKKSNTVHTLIEEVMRKHQVRLEAKKIRLTKHFEADLPETMVPEAHLRYVLNSILEYAIVSISSGESIEFLTTSSGLQKGREGDGQDIEIRVTLTGHRRIEGLDLELRMIQEIVQRNRGEMKTEMDEEKKRAFFSIRFPVERKRGIQFSAFP